jgi:glycosyltransferase involved in cell wall biosynthesis
MRTYQQGNAFAGRADVKLPSLSIITPSYNQAEFIGHTIRSVLDQGYPGLEYWVMDGGSTDGTVDILRRHANLLQFVSEKDGGQAAALNAGFRRTQGEIIGWINSDDAYAPGAFEAVGRFFAEHPDVEWLYGRCPIIDRAGELHKDWVTSYKEFWMRRYSYRRYLIENFVSQPAVFFRRRLLDKVGPIDEQYHCAFDYHLFIRMATESRPAYLNRELAYFRSYDANKSSTVFERSFTEELDAARRVANGRHPFLMFLHRMNRLKLITTYKLLAWAADSPRRSPR